MVLSLIDGMTLPYTLYADCLVNDARFPRFPYSKLNTKGGIHLVMRWHPNAVPYKKNKVLFLWFAHAIWVLKLHLRLYYFTMLTFTFTFSFSFWFVYLEKQKNVRHMGA